MASRDDSNPEYWAEYSNLQKIKHDLIRCYLGGWFAKLGSWAGRVVYFDTHAGRGAHANGQLGSPLVALDTLLGHRALQSLLEKSEFRFFLIERDANNLEQLKKEIATRTLPPKVHVDPRCRDAFVVLNEVAKRSAPMAPAFVFVDPYGFKVPATTLRALLKAGRVELFVNVIWRELDMAVAQGRRGDKPGMEVTLNEVFDGEEWKAEIVADDIDERAEQAVRLLARKLGAKWHTFIRMIGDNGHTRYLLLHLTNHDAGRDLMKDCIWNVAPDGGYYARKSVDPGQLLLITPEADLGALREWVVERLKQRPKRWRELQSELRPELWRRSHLNEVIRALRKDGLVVASSFSGRFSEGADPLLSLA